MAEIAAIATGLGVRTGAVLAAQEGSTVVPLVTSGVVATAAASTPVEPGNLNVTAQVTVEVEIQP